MKQFWFLIQYKALGKWHCHTMTMPFCLRLIIVVNDSSRTKSNRNTHSADRGQGKAHADCVANTWADPAANFINFFQRKSLHAANVSLKSIIHHIIFLEN